MLQVSVCVASGAGLSDAGDIWGGPAALRPKTHLCPRSKLITCL